MNRFETQSPSLFERCFAALFSGAAAAATCAGWLFYRSGAWGAEQIASFKALGFWIVLISALLGFVAGISLVGAFWGEVWDSRDQPLISLRTALILLALLCITYGVFKHLGQ